MNDSTLHDMHGVARLMYDLNWVEAQREGKTGVDASYRWVEAQGGGERRQVQIYLTGETNFKDLISYQL